ncbi:hypothetical protein DFH09DRAFT_1178113 [Mycena vulgaris]|nr:hypothetical protein DFH09DRAFT_1178113 [Mycena vulgaris]
MKSPLLSSAGSMSSFQSSDTIRQAPSTSATSIACSDDHRWSEVVPPESGLTFAVVWDPEEEDILTFSSAGLTESFDQSPDSPSDAYSQILTIGPSVASASEYTTTPQFFRETHDFLFTESTCPDRPIRGRTQTSSTLDGLDVYLRGSMLGQAHNTNRYYSCFQELDSDFAFDPQTSFAKWMKAMEGSLRDDVSDEGFFEGGKYSGMNDDENEVNMSSAFSVTTTSTSNYIAVENEMDDDASTSTWSALEAPNTPSYSRLLFTAPPPSNRRLRKVRPTTAASPSAVLDRPEYSHNLPVPARIETPGSLRPSPSRPGTPLSRSLSMPKFARGLGRWKKADAAGWVWIDVKEEARLS